MKLIGKHHAELRTGTQQFNSIKWWFGANRDFRDVHPAWKTPNTLENKEQQKMKVIFLETHLVTCILQWWCHHKQLG